MRLTNPPISCQRSQPTSTVAALLLLVSLTLPTMATALAEPITLFYENRAPFTYIQAGELLGVEGKSAADAFKAAGYEFTLSEAPGARQIEWIGRNIDPSCAVGIYRTAEREKLGKFTLPIYTKQSKILVVRADNRKINSFRSWSEVLENPLVSVVMRNGYSYGEKLDAMLARAKARVKRLPAESRERVRLILEGTTDGAIFTPIEAEYQIKQFGDEGKALIMMRFPDSPPPEPSYIYCSKSVDDKILDKLNEYIKKLPLNAN